MSIDQKAMKATEAAFRALDVEPENQRIAELPSDVASIEAAIGRAEARRDEISALLHPRGPSAGAPIAANPGVALADALMTLDPAEAIDAQHKEEDLRAEFKQLGEGMAELRRRAERLRQEILTVQKEADRKAYEAARPLMEELVAEAQDAGRRIAETSAALKALSAATGLNPPMANQLKAAVDALTVNQGFGGLLQGNADREQAAPAEITALLAHLEGKGAALRLTKRGLYYGGH